MNTVPTHTVIGYDADSGKKLFTEANRASRTAQEPDTLPRANHVYVAGNGKTYRVIGVRKGSTETLVEIDVREEP
jgi:hypothetical protein